MISNLVYKYLLAVKERDALNEGTMTTEETAGYWLHEAAHDPLVEFDRMLAENYDPLYDVVEWGDELEETFYGEVRRHIIQALNQ